jgi:hypothetical protein
MCDLCDLCDPHRADVQGFMLRAFMTIANVFITDTRWLSVLYLVSECLAP